MALILKRRHFVTLASPSSSIITPMNLALFLSKVRQTLSFLIHLGFIELPSTSVAVASLLEIILPNVSNYYATVGFQQHLNNRKRSLHSPYSKTFISWRCKAKSPYTTTTTQFSVLLTHMNSKKWRYIIKFNSGLESLAITFFFYYSTDILSFIECSGFGEIFKLSNMLREDMIPMELTQPLLEN